MRNKHIIAYFDTEDQAEDVAMKLQSLKTSNIAVERIPVDKSVMNNFPAMPQGIGNLFQGAIGFMYPAAWGVDNAVNQSEQNLNEKNIMLSFVAEKESINDAIEVIHQGRGQIK
ncbi:hypothetical protein [Chengkuizengella axinellae]|uniref:General stress protein 17M-like domain-containing protein n=1 Tax=Chengkuizengella axinellae TaxID=3064388 RepID=A0ABT9IUN1_9BACL|nr:hypothetical protein [Chengkuizengella sp. 2205SS18-9]MDP5273071.1 hypothetical protein [Chengkuizengella sp. 2205SS18-9]